MSYILDYLICNNCDKPVYSMAKCERCGDDICEDCYEDNDGCCDRCVEILVNEKQEEDAEFWREFYNSRF